MPLGAPRFMAIELKSNQGRETDLAGGNVSPDPRGTDGGEKALSPPMALPELRQILGPMVHPLLRDETGALDPGKLPKESFETFRKFLLTQVKVDGIAFNQVLFDSYHKVLSKEEYRPLLERLYKEVKGGPPPEGEGDAALLSRFTGEIIEVSAQRFVSHFVQSGEGRGRIRSILTDKGHYTQEIRADVAKAVAQTGYEMGTSTRDFVAFNQHLSVMNYANVGIDEEEMQKATGLAEGVLKELESIEGEAHSLSGKYLESPSEVRRFPRLQEELGKKIGDQEIQAKARLAQGKGSSLNPLDQLKAKLSQFWLLVVDGDHWEGPNAYKKGENAAYLIRETERFLAEAETVKDEAGLVRLNSEIRDFLLGGLHPKGEGSDFLSSARVKDMLSVLPQAHRAPYEDLKQWVDEIFYAADMGERVFYDGKLSPAGGEGGAALQEIRGRLLGGLIQAKRSLWYGYKQHRALSRGISQVASWVGQGDIEEIKQGQFALDHLIEKVEAAKDGSRLEAAVRDLQGLLQSEGKLHRALQASEMEGCEQMLGLAQTILILLASRGLLKGAQAVAKIAPGTGITTLPGAAVKSFGVGFYLSAAENAVAAASGELRPDGENIFNWIKDSTATGLSMMATVPFGTLLGHQGASVGLTRQLTTRYFSGLQAFAGHVTADAALETAEEWIDATLRAKMDDDHAVIGKDQAREIAMAASFGGGFAKMATLAEMLKGNRPAGTHPSPSSPEKIPGSLPAIPEAETSRGAVPEFESLAEDDFISEAPPAPSTPPGTPGLEESDSHSGPEGPEDIPFAGPNDLDEADLVLEEDEEPVSDGPPPWTPGGERPSDRPTVGIDTPLSFDGNEAIPSPPPPEIPSPVFDETELRHTISELEIQLARKDGERLGALWKNNEFKLQMEEQAEEILRQQEQIESLDAERSDLIAAEEEARNKISELGSEITLLQEELENEKASQQAAEQRERQGVGALNAEIQLEKSRAELAASNLQKREGRIAELEGELAALRQTLAETQGHLEASDQQRAETETRLENAKNRTKTLIEKIRGEMAQRDERIQSLSQNLEQERAISGQARQQVEQAQARITELTEERDALALRLEGERTQVRDTASQVQAREAQIAQLESQLAGQAESLGRLELQLQRTQASLEGTQQGAQWRGRELQGQLAETRGQLDKSETDREELEALSQTAKQQWEEARQRHQELEQEISTLRSDLISTKDQLRLAERQARETERRLEEKNKALGQLETDLQDQQRKTEEQISQFEAEKTSLAEERDREKTRADEAVSRNEELTGQLQALRNELVLGKGQLMTVQTELEKTKVRLTEEREHITTLNQRIGNFENIVSQATEQSRHKDMEIRKLTTQIETLGEEKDLSAKAHSETEEQLKGRITALEEEKAQFENKAMEAKDELVVLETRLQTAEGRAGRLQEKLGVTEREKERQDGELKELQAKYDQMETEHLRLLRDKEQWDLIGDKMLGAQETIRELREELSSQKENSQIRIDSLEERVREAEGYVEILDRQLTTAKDEAEERTRQLNEKDLELTDVRRSLSASYNENKNLRAENEGLTRRKGFLAEQEEILTREVAELRREKDEARHKTETAQGELERSQRQLSELETALQNARNELEESQAKVRELESYSERVGELETQLSQAETQISKLTEMEAAYAERIRELSEQGGGPGTSIEKAPHTVRAEEYQRDLPLQPPVRKPTPPFNRSPLELEHDREVLQADLERTRRELEEAQDLTDRLNRELNDTTIHLATLQKIIGARGPALINNKDPRKVKVDPSVNLRLSLTNQEGRIMGRSDIIAGGREGFILPIRTSDGSRLSAKTTKGVPKRHQGGNEDAVYTSHFLVPVNGEMAEVKVLAGADGAGGEKRGDLATVFLQGVHAVVAEAAYKGQVPTAKELFVGGRQAVDAQHDFHGIKRAPHSHVTGTGAVVVVIGNQAMIATAGDALVTFSRRQADGSYRSEGYSNSDSIPFGNQITNGIHLRSLVELDEDDMGHEGSEPIVQEAPPPNLYQIRNLRPGDRFTLGSDGFYNMMDTIFTDGRNFTGSREWQESNFKRAYLLQDNFRLLNLLLQRTYGKEDAADFLHDSAFGNMRNPGGQKFTLDGREIFFPARQKDDNIFVVSYEHGAPPANDFKISREYGPMESILEVAPPPLLKYQTAEEASVVTLIRRYMESLDLLYGPKAGKVVAGHLANLYHNFPDLEQKFNPELLATAKDLKETRTLLEVLDNEIQSHPEIKAGDNLTFKKAVTQDVQGIKEGAKPPLQAGKEETRAFMADNHYDLIEVFPGQEREVAKHFADIYKNFPEIQETFNLKRLREMDQEARRRLIQQMQARLSPDIAPPHLRLMTEKAQAAIHEIRKLHDSKGKAGFLQLSGARGHVQIPTWNLKAGTQYTIGRQKGADIQFDHRTLSRKHIKIFSKDGQWYVEDLRSSLGSYVGDKKLKPGTPQPLPKKAQSTLALGNIKFLFQPRADGSAILVMSLESVNEAPEAGGPQSHFDPDLTQAPASERVYNDTFHFENDGTTYALGHYHIPDDLLSKLHVEFMHNGEEWLARDAGSLHGTWLDGKEIHKPLEPTGANRPKGNYHALSSGSVLQIGGTFVQVSLNHLGHLDLKRINPEEHEVSIMGAARPPMIKDDVIRMNRAQLLEIGKSQKRKGMHQDDLIPGRYFYTLQQKGFLGKLVDDSDNSFFSIVRNGDQYWIQNEGLNEIIIESGETKTRVKKSSQVTLKRGDWIQFGNQRLEFQPS